MNETHVPGCADPFVFLHVGDQHLTRPGRRNHRDLATIFRRIADLPPASFDLVYLPGDIAENGLDSEYALIDRILRRHDNLPVHLIPGDHDRQYGSMKAFIDFQRNLAVAHPQPVLNTLFRLPEAPGPDRPTEEIPQYYYSRTFGSVRCLFLDMISAGYGRKGLGLDFRLGPTQHRWLAGQIALARQEGKTCAVFMHTYPDDLDGPEAAEVGGLFWNAGVRLVEMGHTHYNELAHDGRTTYAAARSVGQNEDGSVGYAVGAIDSGEVSWRFRPLDRKAPFVLITSPVDRRLATGAVVPDAQGFLTVRAMVLSKRDVTCRYRVDDGPWDAMVPAGRAGLYAARVPWPVGSRRLTVEAFDDRWPGYDHDYIDRDVIEPAGPVFLPPVRPARPGSDACRIGAWLEKGVRGDQLGPNRAGREW